MGESISKKASGISTGGVVFLVLFLGLFCAIGILVGTFLSFLPMYRAMQSQSWQQLSCEVISSRLERSDDTARPDIQYRYYVDDTPFTSSRYNFVPGSTSDISGHQQVVDRHPAGKRFECYVDPADPSSAVINRDLTWAYSFGLIFFFAFTGIPAVIGLVALRASRRKPARDGRDAEAASGLFDTTDATHSTFRSPDFGPIVLSPKQSPTGKLIVAIIICLFWNGITGVFTYFEIRDFMAGEPNWFLAIFLLLFQLVGLALLLNVPYQMLALANPRPTITLSQRSVPVGGSLSLEWKLSGAAHRVRTLRLTLEGREEAHYRRGTDTHTDTHVFHRATLREITDSIGIARGMTALQVPRDTMHTFTADNNKIIWTIHMKGDINRWPDIDESFDINVTAR